MTAGFAMRISSSIACTAASRRRSNRGRRPTHMIASTWQRAPVLKRNLPRCQTCGRRELRHELIIQNGSVNDQLRYLKLDRVFLPRSPDLYVRWETHPIDIPVFV